MIASSVSSNGATETNVQVDAKTLKECLISAGKGGSSPRVKKDATYDFAGHLVVNQVLRHLAIALLRDDAFGPKRGGDTTFTGLVEVQAAVFQGNLIVASNKHNEKLCENLKKLFNELKADNLKDEVGTFVSNYKDKNFDDKDRYESLLDINVDNCTILGIRRIFKEHKQEKCAVAVSPQKPQKLTGAEKERKYLKAKFNNESEILYSKLWLKCFVDNNTFFEEYKNRIVEDFQSGNYFRIDKDQANYDERLDAILQDEDKRRSLAKECSDNLDSLRRILRCSLEETVKNSQSASGVSGTESQQIKPNNRAADKIHVVEYMNDIQGVDTHAETKIRAYIVQHLYDPKDRGEELLPVSIAGVKEPCTDCALSEKTESGFKGSLWNRKLLLLRSNSVIGAFFTGNQRVDTSALVVTSEGIERSGNNDAPTPSFCFVDAGVAQTLLQDFIRSLYQTLACGKFNRFAGTENKISYSQRDLFMGEEGGLARLNDGTPLLQSSGVNNMIRPKKDQNNTETADQLSPPGDGEDLGVDVDPQKIKFEFCKFVNKPMVRINSINNTWYTYLERRGLKISEEKQSSNLKISEEKKISDSRAQANLSKMEELRSTLQELSANTLLVREKTKLPSRKRQPSTNNNIVGQTPQAGLQNHALSNPQSTGQQAGNTSSLSVTRLRASGSLFHGKNAD